MGLAQLVRRSSPSVPADAERALSWNDYANLLSTMSIGGHQYVLSQPGLVSAVHGDAYERNGAVGALIAVRQLVFSDIRFVWRPFRNGRPDPFFTDFGLSLLQRPWPNGHTGSLMKSLEVDGSIHGNAYFIRERSAFRNEEQLTRLDPEHTLIVTGSGEGEFSASQPYGRYLLGYSYQENPGADAVLFPYREVAHFKPLACRTMPQFRGMSWLQPVLADVEADMHLTAYKTSFVRNGAVPGLVVSLEAGISMDQFEAFRRTMDSAHSGPWQAGKTLFLGGGADVTTVGQSFDQLNLKAVQGAGETRLAAMAGVGAVIARFSEGMQGSSLNAGNYGAARRQFADMTARPWWAEACRSLSVLVSPSSRPNGAGVELWYDDTDNSFLQEDRKDDAEIQSRRAVAIESLVRSGFEPDSARDAVNTGDFSKLRHTGLVSVQLLPPGTTGDATATE